MKGEGSVAAADRLQQQKKFFQREEDVEECVLQPR
jgi:hypothetical protein